MQRRGLSRSNPADSGGVLVGSRRKQLRRERERTSCGAMESWRRRWTRRSQSCLVAQCARHVGICSFKWYQVSTARACRGGAQKSLDRSSGARGAIPKFAPNDTADPPYGLSAAGRSRQARTLSPGSPGVRGSEVPRSASVGPRMLGWTEVVIGERGGSDGKAVALVGAGQILVGQGHIFTQA